MNVRAFGGNQPHGKQKLKTEGCWHTRVFGIRQTVWLEGVPEEHVANVHAESWGYKDSPDPVKLAEAYAGFMDKLTRPSEPEIRM